MQHDEIRSSIAAWATGRIDPAARRVIEAHLAECAACKAVAETAVTLAGALGRGGDALFEAHPEVDALRRYAQLPVSSRDPAVERHVASCASCTLEVQMWRTEPTIKTIASRRRPWGRDVWIAATGVAAGLLLGLLVSRGFRVPEPSPPRSVSRVLVQSAMRGTGGEPELVLQPGAAFGLVDAAFELPAEIEPHAIVRFQIRDAAGNSSWTTTEPVANIAAHLAQNEIVGFLVPAEVLTDGEHRFEVSSGGSILLSAQFRVRRDETK